MKKLTIILLLCSSAWADGPLFNSSDTYTQREFVNVYQNIRNPSILSGKATNLTVSNLTVSTMTVSQILGTTTNNDAGIGQYGEFIAATWSVVPDSATGAFSDAASIQLTAGDWDIEVHAEMGVNEVASVTRHILGISTTPGNSAAGLTQGTTRLDAVVPGANANMALSIPRVRASLAGTVIYYAKIEGTYTGTIPTSQGIISARRPR